jgi:hypothetical protein
MQTRNLRSARQRQPKPDEAAVETRSAQNAGSGNKR